LTNKTAASAPGETSTRKPTSKLRFSHTSATAGDATDTTPRPSARPTSAHGQFNATPKFAFAQPKRHDALLISPKKPKAAPKFERWGEEYDREAIEDAEEEVQGSEGDEMILETTEDDVGGRDNWIPSPKRQRLSLDGTSRSRIMGRQASEDAFLPQPGIDMPPGLPTPAFSVKHTPATRRFLFTQPAPSPSVVSASPFPDDSNAPVTRPTFLKPATAPLETSEPLPEAFSPHRRGQKFLTGGMAAEVRQWIVDATQVAHVRKAGGDVLRVRVMESRGCARDGVVLVRASVQGKEVKLMLPGAGKGKSNASLAVGEIVAVKAPTWDVVVDGVTWVVAADWRVLQDGLSST
jgi:hypothetical protein